MVTSYLTIKVLRMTLVRKVGSLSRNNLKINSLKDYLSNLGDVKYGHSLLNYLCNSSNNLCEGHGVLCVCYCIKRE